MPHANGFRNVTVCEALVNDSAFSRKPRELKMK